MSSTNVLCTVLTKFNQVTKSPERFLGSQSDLTADIKHLVKELYDFIKDSEGPSLKKSTARPLPELIIDDLDEEQIWQELELQNDAKYNELINNVPLLAARRDKLKFPVKLKGTEHAAEKESSKDFVSCSDIEDESTQEEAASLNENVPPQLLKDSPKPKSSVVDDRFFRLQDLEKYLDIEDKKENDRLKGRNKNDDDDSVDYFEDNSSGDEEEELHYADFFDDPEVYESSNKEKKVDRVYTKEGSEGNDDDDCVQDGDVTELDEEGNENAEESSKKTKQVRFNLYATNTDTESSEPEDSAKQDQEVKSNFETRQERLKSRIEHLEKESLAEKPWQLKGEVSAGARPQNSLLEEVLEFDLTTRPAPIITEQTTVKLEDIICQRIKDKSWDDVERKVRPVQTPCEYKKQLVMNQEKSKLSLAEVYEQEYIKQREALNPDNQDKPEEVPKEHQEVRGMMSALFAKLDALSNFHYTPKMVAPEIKIISNLPAITMEEVAPVATTDAALLAPEEVKAKPKGDVVGKGERTETDKKRERRHKKAMQRHHHKEKEKREKIVEKLRPGMGNKYSKEKALKMLEKVSKEKNVEQVKDMGKQQGVKSSSAFFAHLQEEVTNHIKAKMQSKKRTQESNHISAKKMKL